jgi:hypothetical protein
MKLHFNSSGPATKTLSAAIYARVSTANNVQDPTMQTRELSEYCGRRGWRIAGEYVDLGISGTKERRPELDRLMADAHQRRFDVVVVWRFDRFARSVSHLLRALETFKALGVEFVSFSEQLDTSTPAGKMVFTVLRRRGGTRTVTHRRARESGASKCPIKGETPRSAQSYRRYRKDCLAAGAGTLLAADCETDGCFG